jgi:hypothetical protein
MANLHGMKFDPIPLPLTYSFQHNDVMPREHGLRHRVHADSLHLLGPQVKDLAIDGFGKPFKRFENGWLNARGYRVPAEYSNMRIVQRDGKPFFWPKREMI